ncbi:MAG: FKBP-type peptidyl-prolyl cis-trans isomerase [Prevotella sp.]|jgi:FKBP-type peptidyl-prolyl cis-trans isomerase FklB|nr:FKBP-type peptidyl-prolyl cis-trans isomerase [Prevotella sp.]
MKKIQVVALGAFAALGTLFTSCGGGVSSDASLKTENDTVSYAFGASLYDQGLSMHLQQLGVVSDTTGLNAHYKRQIEAEQDSLKKDSLRIVMKHKLDSTVKVNTRNIAEFLKGLKESINAPDSKTAYYTGVSVGGQISKQMFPNLIAQMYGPDSKEKINPDIFTAALATALKKGKFAVDDPAALFQTKMQEAQARQQAKQEEELKKQHAPQIEAGQKFLDENKAKEGVVTLADGLQYKIIKEGKGAKPTASDVVKVHYHGTLLDGTVFDSSVDRKEPSTFNVSAVIKGWTEVLQLMPVGSKWQVYIPYDLAYGSQDRGTIKPFSTLIFDIELLSIEKK